MKYKVGDRIRYSTSLKATEQIYMIIQVYDAKIPRYLCSNGKYKRMLFEDDIGGRV